MGWPRLQSDHESRRLHYRGALQSARRRYHDAASGSNRPPLRDVIFPTSVVLGRVPGSPTPKSRRAHASPPASRAGGWGDSRASDVVIERELVGVWPQPDGIRFVPAFVIDERLDQFFGEHIALQQEGMIIFQAPQRFFE